MTHRCHAINNDSRAAEVHVSSLDTATDALGTCRSARPEGATIRLRRVEQGPHLRIAPPNKDIADGSA